MLNQIEKKIFGPVLSLASDELINATPVLCTKENQAELIAFINEFIDRGEDNDEDYREHLLAQAVPGKRVDFQDWMLIRFLIRKLDL